MTSPMTTEPACPGAPTDADHRPQARSLAAVRRRFDSIDRVTWDRLAGANPWSTPFSRWAFHRAWWDGFGSSAHDETLVIVDADEGFRRADAAEPVAIAPLMHRHQVEPTDAETYTRMRHGSFRGLTAVPASAKTIFMGASYHADYQTLLAGGRDFPRAADAVAGYVARPDADVPWDAIDLRRLRCGDPAADALALAFGRREVACNWTVNVEREDVCPVVRLGDDVRTIDDYLATLGKKQRHEVRRKVRRSETAGETILYDSSDPLEDLGKFVELHQKRWGDHGLFPDTAGGRASRRFFTRLFELFGPEGTLRLSLLTVGGRAVAAAVWFADPDRVYFFNAGVDPDARAISPGVVMIERLIRRMIEDGRRELDFLRGDEPYKYEWGAVDEPLQRLLVRRTAD